MPTRLVHLLFNFGSDRLVIPCLYCASVGAVFGYLLLRKASRLNPIGALRDE